MKRFILVIGALILTGITTAHAELKYHHFSADSKATVWEMEKGKNLNDIVYKEKGEIITVLVVSGVIMTYVKSPNGIFRCSDLTLEEDKIGETVCFKLVQP